jgi:hypothetical protein
LSKSAFVNDAAIIGGERDDARNEPRFYRLPQDLIDSYYQLGWDPSGTACADERRAHEICKNRCACQPVSSIAS